MDVSVTDYPPAMRRYECGSQWLELSVLDDGEWAIGANGGFWAVAASQRRAFADALSAAAAPLQLPGSWAIPHRPGPDSPVDGRVRRVYPSAGWDAVRLVIGQQETRVINMDLALAEKIATDTAALADGVPFDELDPAVVRPGQTLSQSLAKARGLAT